MRHLKLILSICIALLLSLDVSAQKDAKILLRKVYDKLQIAKDYSVQATINVDMPFIHMLPVEVKIYFKQKDKFKVISKGIAIVPRQGFDQASKMLADTSTITAMIQGEEKNGLIKTIVVNVVPLSDNSDMVLGKLWVDPLQKVIMKSQITTRSNGTIVTEYSYGTNIKYGLPDKMIFIVDVQKFKLPKNVTNDIESGSGNEDKEKGKQNKAGKIIIDLTNYVVNKGVPDSVFEK